MFVLAAAAITLGCREAPVEPPQAAPEAKRHARVQVADAEALRGVMAAAAGRATLVNIWATWCGPCVEEMPDLIRVYRAYESRGLAFVSLSADLAAGTSEQVAPFAEEHAIPFAIHVLDGIPPDEVAALLGVAETDWDGALPATFLFDAAGALRQSWFTAVDYAALDAAIRPLLAGG
ncbi:MAG: TlpA family protein disulfide reductase [Candidatus Hydrogenedentes bacterium]|nr:TlpA family protein disulfide reductase [Candidatus Hydrogenedentota bacterium]